MKNLFRAAAVAAVVIGFNFGTWFAPAQADQDPASNWKGVDTGAGPVFNRTDSELSGVPECDTAIARWEHQYVDVATNGGGTSVETRNLGVEVDTGDVVSVDYELIEGADPAAGSVRLFIYMAPDQDTVNTAPAKFTTAPDDGSTSGTLSFTVPAGGTIGTAGVVYDTSNGGVEGAVKFTNLTVAGETVFFLKGCLPIEESPTPTPTEVTPSPTPTETGTPVPGTDGSISKPDLPVTGASYVPLLGGGAAVLTGLGLGLYLLGRRRNQVPVEGGE